MSGIVRNSMRAVVIASMFLGAMSAARAQEEWRTLSGEALWDQAAVYEQKHWWGSQAPALAKYLNEAARPGAAAIAPEKLVDARFRLARAEFRGACWTKDFARFYTFLASFETTHTAETARIATLRQMWTVVPVSLGDWAEGTRRMQWYLETYPSAPESALVKRDLGQKKWDDGKRDEAIADLQAVVAQSPNNPNLASVFATLAECVRTRDGREAAVALLEKALSTSPPLPESAPLHFQLARDYLNLKRYDEVATHTQYVIENDLYGGQAPDAAKFRAWALERAGRPAEGLAYLEEVVRRYADTMPEFHHVIQERTDFQLKLLGPDAAIASLEAHVAAHPALSSAGDAVYVLSQVDMKRHGSASAIAKLEAIAKAHPNTRAGRDALFVLPELCLFEGDLRAAVTFCRQYLQQYPGREDAETLRNREPYYLLRARFLGEAEKAAEARIAAGKTPSRRDVIPAFVLTYTLGLKSKRLAQEGKKEESDNAAARGREVFNIYLQLAEAEDITYTLGLYTLWGENDKMVDLATRYLAAHPEESTRRVWVQCHLAVGQISPGSTPETVAKAAKMLDEMRARQQALYSASDLGSALGYESTQWPYILGLRIGVARKLNDDEALRECLLELRDQVPRSLNRDNVIRGHERQSDRLNVPFPTDVKRRSEVLG